MNLLQKVAIVFILLCVSFVAGISVGIKYADGQHAKAALKVVEKQIEHKEANQAVADSAAKETRAETEKVKVVYRTITKKVIEYRDNPVSQTKCLDDQWVELHNLAARGEHPQP